MRSLITLVTLSVLAIPTMTRADGSKVSAQEIQEQWIGKELIGTTASGARVIMRLDSNGTASVSVGDSGDTGTWRVSNDGYCTTWRTIRAGQERCFAVLKSGSVYRVLNPDGTLSGYFNQIGR